MRLCGILFVALLWSHTVNAQYDTIWVGTPDGPSTSLANTPFPTEVAKAARTQYLVRSSALEQAGLLPGMEIHGVCLQVLDNDPSTPPCLTTIHTSMKNDMQAELVFFIGAGEQNTGVSGGVNLTEGILGLPSNTLPGWQWTGAGFNMLLEVNLERGEEPGSSPRIMLDTDLDHTATFTGRTNMNIMGGAIGSDPVNEQYESDNSLPYLGLLVDATSGTAEHPRANGIACFPSPCSTTLEVRANEGTRSLFITDMLGRPVLDGALSNGTARIDIGPLRPGSYVLQGRSANGAVVPTVFLKE
jgi:hypothetical protein